MIVVDASVLVDLLGEGPPKASIVEMLRMDSRWEVPRLWRAEVVNVLATRMRHRAVSIADALMRYAVVAEIIDGREHPVAPERVLRACAASGCTAYDCEYVVLAETLGVPLVTGDRQVLDAFPGLAITPEAFVRRGR